MPDIDEGSRNDSVPKDQSTVRTGGAAPVFGRMRGKIRMADDFDAPLPDEILDQFESGPIFPRP